MLHPEVENLMESISDIMEACKLVELEDSMLGLKKLANMTTEEKFLEKAPK